LLAKYYFVVTNLFWSYQVKSTRGAEKMPYPIIMDGQSSAIPSSVVVAERSYSSSSLDHSPWLLEGQSRRRGTRTSQDQCPQRCQSYKHVVGTQTRAEPTGLIEVVRVMLIGRNLIALHPHFKTTRLYSCIEEQVDVHTTNQMVCFCCFTWSFNLHV
jgi:hypothetical protein